MSKGRGKIDPKDGEATQFSSTNQPQNAGRKPRVFSQIALEFKKRGIERATPEAVAEAYEYLLALTMAEVGDIAIGENQTDDLPAIMSLAAQEMKGKRALEIIREMLDRAHGKSINRHEVGGKGGGAIKMDFSKLSTEDLREMSKMRKKAMANGDTKPNTSNGK